MAATNTAYKLNTPSQPKRQQRPELRVVRTPRHALASAFTPKVLCAFALVVTMLSLIIYNQVCLNEVTGQINKLNESIAILENEQVRYISQLESAVSMRTVQQVAEEQLGMVKLDQYQTVQVNLYQEDRINLAEPPADSTGGGGILATLGTAIDAIKEYIAGN